MKFILVNEFPLVGSSKSRQVRIREDQILGYGERAPDGLVWIRTASELHCVAESLSQIEEKLNQPEWAEEANEG